MIKNVITKKWILITFKKLNNVKKINIPKHLTTPVFISYICRFKNLNKIRKFYENI